MDKKQLKLHDMIQKQARSDPVCAEYLFVQAKHAKLGGGFEFIETVLDMQDEFDDDFRLY